MINFLNYSKWIYDNPVNKRINNCIIVRILPLAFAALLFSACVNTKAVSDYSTASKQGLELYESLPYDFAKNCHDTCNLHKIQTLNFESGDCDCTSASQADSIITLIYSQLNRYLAGLSALSSKDLTSYNTTDLGNALSEGVYGKMIVSKDEADAFSKISATVSNLITGHFRKEKLKKYVLSANEPFQKLIQLLDFNIQRNLVGLLNSHQLTLRKDHFSLIRDPGLSEYEKRRVMENYYQQTALLENDRQVLLSYSKSLRAIGEGHAELTKNIDHFSEDQIRTSLANSAAQIEYLISRFKSLKNKS